VAEVARKGEGNLRYDVVKSVKRPQNHTTFLAAWRDRKAFDAYESSAYACQFPDTVGRCSARRSTIASMCRSTKDPAEGRCDDSDFEAADERSLVPRLPRDRGGVRAGVLPPAPSFSQPPSRSRRPGEPKAAPTRFLP
jgi:quinol monooxygenase YgiN